MNENQPVPLSWFAKTVKKYVHIIFEISFITFILRMLELVEPFAFQALIDRVIPFQREASLWIILLLLVCVTFFELVLGGLSTYLGGHTGNRITKDISSRLYKHVLHLRLPFLQKWPVGELLARVGDIDETSEFLSSTLAGAVLDVLFSIIFLGALFFINTQLAMIVIIILPLQGFALFCFGPFLRSRLKDAFAAGARHQSRLVETFGNMLTFKSFAFEKKAKERFVETLDESLHTDFKLLKLNIASGTIQKILEQIVNLSIIIYGASLIFAGEITLGQLIAFHMLVGKIEGPISNLTGLWEEWQNLKITRVRLGDLLNVETEEPESKPPLNIEGEGVVEVNQVYYEYDEGFPIFNNISYIARPGKCNLIVGSSGVGKSTFAKLLSGLYVPDIGAVKFDGQNIVEFNEQTVRQNITYVPQDAELFDGSIIDNLLWVRDELKEDEVVTALRLADAFEFVKSLPFGLNTEVGEHGSSLSGGQRQRIALARAFLLNPTVMILDEPSSALDADARSHLVNSLVELSKNKTIIVITHSPNIFPDDSVIFNLSEEISNQKKDEVVGMKVSTNDL